MKTSKTSNKVLQIRTIHHGAKLVLGGSLSAQGYASRMATCYRIAACVCALIAEERVHVRRGHSIWTIPEVDPDGFYVRVEEGPSQEKVIELLTKAAQVAGFTIQESV